MTFKNLFSCRDYLTDKTFPNFITLIPSLTFTELRMVSRGEFATGVACQQEMLTLPDTWFRPFLGLAYAPMVETNFPELAVFPDFSSQVTISWYMYFLDFASSVFVPSHVFITEILLKSSVFVLQICYKVIFLILIRIWFLKMFNSLIGVEVLYMKKKIRSLIIYIGKEGTVNE